MRNPFTPTFGKVPAYLAGREYLVNELMDALENGPGDPSQTSILVGARGTGKTATLAFVCAQAESLGWIAVSVSCFNGMLQDILEQVARKTSHVLDANVSRKLTGISASTPLGGISMNWENVNEGLGNWRSRMTDVLEALNAQGIGLLLAVDEMDPDIDEMNVLVSVFQHFVTEERKTALFMAGLPHKVSQMLKGRSVSFLRRASRKELGGISDSEVAIAFEKVAEMGGKAFEPVALNLAVEGSQGFPYMMQLVGFRSWAQSGESAVITEEDVRRGVLLADDDMKSRVLRQTLDELSLGDLLFLRAMLPDAVDSDQKQIVERLGKSPSHVSTYKRRLLDAGVIETTVRKRVGFALPGLREYLPEYLEESQI